MQAILLTGKMGEGKSLCAVSIMQEVLKRGGIVATNMNLNLEHLTPAWCKTTTIRLPDIPSSEDIDNLPDGNPNPIDTENNGILVLDETATYLNSRDWQDKDRAKLISKLSQIRKRGYDLVLIAQGADMVDAQIRKALLQLHGVCKCMDKLGIPFLTPLFAHFGIKLRMPKIHVVSYFYGFGGNAPKAYRETRKGTHLYKAYDTLQQIKADAKTDIKQEFGSATCTMLSAYHIKGRYQGKIKMYKNVAISFTLLGALLSLPFHYWYETHRAQQPQKTEEITIQDEPEKTAKVTGAIKNPNGYTLTLNDGQTLQGQDYKTDDTGTTYTIKGKNYHD